MSTIKKEAIKRALLLLKAGGAKFLVVEEDGERHGDIIEAPRKTVTSRTTLREQFDLRTTGYVDAVRGLDVGGSHVITVPKECTLKRMQKAISGAGVKYHGVGACITSIDKERNAVEILRVQ